MTIGKAPDYLKFTERAIYRREGVRKIPAFKVGGGWRFSTAEIEAWVRDHNAIRKVN